MKLNKVLRRRRHPAVEFASENSALLLAGAAAGAALVYLTTGRGKRQRAAAVDRTVSAVRSGADALGERARGLRDRTKGLLHESGVADGRRRPHVASAMDG